MGAGGDLKSFDTALVTHHSVGNSVAESITLQLNAMKRGTPLFFSQRLLFPDWLVNWFYADRVVSEDVLAGTEIPGCGQKRGRLHLFLAHCWDYT